MKQKKKESINWKYPKKMIITVRLNSYDGGIFCCKAELGNQEGIERWKEGMGEGWERSSEEGRKGGGKGRTGRRERRRGREDFSQTLRRLLEGVAVFLSMIKKKT